jgi:hypothetical protein
LVYHALNTPANPFPGRAVLVLDDSSWHEELTADWINKTSYRLHSRGMVVEIGDFFPWLKDQPTYTCRHCKTEVPPERMHGHIDGVVTDLLGIDRLLEHKAINHFSFERIWKGQWPLDYFAQCAIYMKALKEIVPDIAECLLLIKNKNTAQYIEILLAYDASSDTLSIKEVVRSDGQRMTPEFRMEKVVGQAQEKFAQVESFRALGSLPARPFELGTEFPCGYCPYAQTCWDGYEREFKALESDVVLDQEVEGLCAQYQQMSAASKEIKEKYEELRDRIKQSLLKQEVRGGKAGPYAVTLVTQQSVSWDESQIPPEVVKEAKRLSPYLKLLVKKPENKNGNHTKKEATQ